MVVASLYALYTEQVSDKARDQFVENVIKTATGEANMPATLETASGLLMPQVYGEQKIREKQANLGKAAVLPYMCLDGSDRLLTAGEVAVCVVADFGHATVPVLSATLKQWDCSFNKVLQIATANLMSKNEALIKTSRKTQGKVKGKKAKDKKNKSVSMFEMHPSGCGSTIWHDQYDSTRAALFPHFIQNREAGAGAGTPQGDSVCLFGANQQCLVADSRNPIGLCFMGDMCLDIAKTRDLISNQPYRLATSSASNSAIPAAKPGHPLHKLLTAGLEGTGNIFHWQQYDPKARNGEFSVPEEQGEVDAVLAAVQSGKQIPVFRRETTSPTISAKTAAAAAAKPGANAEWVKLKEKGTGFFKNKDFKQAELWYSKALEAHEQEETDETEQRGAIYSNRSAARLGLNNAKDALTDAQQVIGLRPQWPKGFFRLAKAMESLREYRNAQGAYSKAAAVTMASATSKKGKEAKEAAKLQLQAAEAKGCADRHSVMATPVQKPSRAKVRQLLSDALGWQEGMKEGGTVPGWMPVNVHDTPSARLAATTLYSLVRDRRVTERDRKSDPCSSYCYCYDRSSVADTETECSSPRRPASPAAKIRGAVLKDLAEAGGERTMIVMLMTMSAAATAGTANTDASATAFDTPLEKRDLMQLVQSILEVAELKAATTQFKKLMAQDEDAVKLLGDAMKAPASASASAPEQSKTKKTPPAGASKAAASCCANDSCKKPASVPAQPRKNSKKENDPAQKPVTASKSKPKTKVAKPANTTITLDASTLAGLGSGFGQNDWKGASSSKQSEFIVGDLGSSSSFDFDASASLLTSSTPFGSSAGNSRRGIL
jgi:tetratricopeptide (TPR) repeat protein